MSYVPELEAILLEYDTSERGKAEKDEFGMETAFERLNRQLEKDFPDDEKARFHAQDNATEMFQWGFRIGFLCGNREMVRQLALSAPELKPSKNIFKRAKERRRRMKIRKSFIDMEDRWKRTQDIAWVVSWLSLAVSILALAKRFIS